MYSGEYKSFTIIKIREGMATAYLARHASDPVLGIPGTIETPQFRSEAAVGAHIKGVLDAFNEYMSLLYGNLRPHNIPRAKAMFWRSYAASNGASIAQPGKMARLALKRLEGSPVNETNRAVFRKMADGLSRL
jgi:hypothetical protein